jgi:hypothetical protein
MLVVFFAALTIFEVTARSEPELRSRNAQIQETQVAVERMARELRQAEEISSITGVSLTPTAGAPMSFTFWTDFNGNRFKDYAAVDPEVLTYKWTPASGNLTLSANDSSGHPVTEPVLASKVTAFDVEFLSSSWEYDANGDGSTTWQELDATPAPIGNDNGVPDGTELPLIDLVNVAMAVTDHGHELTYRTQVDLRNQDQD